MGHPGNRVQIIEVFIQNPQEYSLVFFVCFLAVSVSSNHRQSEYTRTFFSGQAVIWMELPLGPLPPVLRLRHPGTLHIPPGSDQRPGDAGHSTAPARLWSLQRPGLSGPRPLHAGCHHADCNVCSAGHSVSFYFLKETL